MNENAKIRNFRDLQVWQMGMGIALDIYRTTREFPKEVLYGLTSQLRRAAISVPSNVAEGFNRLHNKEYAQFLHVALGSCAEMETQVELAADLGYIRDENKRMILDKLDHEQRMLRNLVKRLQAR